MLEFAAITPRELHNALQGANDYNRYLQVEAWERARFVATQVWNSQLAPEDRLNPNELIWLDGDPPRKETSAPKKSTPEAFAEACKKFNIAIPSNNG